MSSLSGGNVASKHSTRLAHGEGRERGADLGGFTGIPGLQHPSDWNRLASSTEQVCRGLVDDVIRGAGLPVASKPTGSVDTVRTLDEISDVLCQTIDAAEFCRHVHHDASWRRAAHAACGQLGAFVHELNTHYGLYTALCTCLDRDAASDASDALNTSDDSEKKKSKQGHQASGARRDMAEYRHVGEMLRRDFERFGVHLEGATRDEMTELVAFIQHAGHEYMTNTIDRSKTGQIVVDEKVVRSESMHGLELPAGVFRRRNQLGGTADLLIASGDSHVCHSLLAHCDSEEVRRAAFHTYHAFPAENGALAGQILAARHRVASIMGYESFGAYQLDGFSLGNTPEAVEAFLKGINETIRDSLGSERRALESYKASRASAGRGALSTGSRIQLHPWDQDWAINGLLAADSTASFQKLHSLVRVSGFVPGMSALLEELIGLRLKEAPLSPGEAWAPDITKLLVVDARSGDVYGTIYLDLLQRPGKFGGAALFTLRCGRRLSNGEYQLPKVALVANISPDNHQYLSFGDLETLCHEFGHAMHSILSRTELQHLSGTRGPQDIIEVPSHVFERFASDRRALSVMVHHSGQDAGTMTDGLMGALDTRRRHFAATKLQRTVKMCLIDQYMHSDRFEGPGFGSKVDIETFMAEHGVPEFDQITEFPPLRFTHLVGYAGNYYSYLFANCIAAEVWGVQHGANDNEDGTGWPLKSTIHDKMLHTGGSKPATSYVGDLVGPDKLITVAGRDGARGFYPDFRPYLRHLNIYI